MKGVILLFILFYRKFVSPLFPRTCRFYPTCSEYVFQAVQNFGVKKGLFLGFKRIVRCNPFNKGGYDPLPKQQ
jgi:putative membrane protein insertion efficiency factor